MPLPSIRRAADSGPSPASSSNTPDGVRTAVQLPPDPLARIQISMDIRVGFAGICRVRFSGHHTLRPLKRTLRTLTNLTPPAKSPSFPDADNPAHPAARGRIWGFG